MDPQQISTTAAPAPPQNIEVIPLDRIQNYAIASSSNQTDLHPFYRPRVHLLTPPNAVTKPVVEWLNANDWSCIWRYTNRPEAYLRSTRSWTFLRIVDLNAVLNHLRKRFPFLIIPRASKKSDIVQILALTLDLVCQEPTGPYSLSVSPEQVSNPAPEINVPQSAKPPLVANHNVLSSARKPQVQQELQLGLQSIPKDQVAYPFKRQYLDMGLMEDVITLEQWRTVISSAPLVTNVLASMPRSSFTIQLSDSILLQMRQLRAAKRPFHVHLMAYRQEEPKQGVDVNSLSVDELQNVLVHTLNHGDIVNEYPYRKQPPISPPMLSHRIIRPYQSMFDWDSRQVHALSLSINKKILPGMIICLRFCIRRTAEDGALAFLRMQLKDPTPMLMLGQATDKIDTGMKNIFLEKGFDTASDVLPSEMNCQAQEKEDDDDIVAGNVQVTLKCPLSYTMMKVPVRGQTCPHRQCFDISYFLQLECKREVPHCPICNGNLYFDELMLDFDFVFLIEKRKELVLQGMDPERLERVTITPQGHYSFDAVEAVARAVTQKRKLQEMLSSSDNEAIVKLQGVTYETVVLDSSDDEAQQHECIVID